MSGSGAPASEEQGFEGVSVPFAISAEEEHLRNVSSLRTEVHERQLREDSPFPSISGLSGSIPSGSGSGPSLPLFSEGGLPPLSQPFRESSEGNDDAFHLENQRLLESRIRALEEIIDIQNEEIHKNLPMEDSEPGDLDSSTVETEGLASSSDMPTRLLSLWRVKVFESLTRTASLELLLAAEKRTQLNLRSSIDLLRSRVQSMDRIMKSETISLKSVIETKDRRLAVLEDELAELRRQTASMAETERISRLRDSKFVETVEVFVRGCDDSVDRGLVTGCERLRQFMTRVGFLQNRVEMIRGILVKKTKSADRVVQDLNETVHRLTGSLQRRNLDAKKEGGEFVSSLEKEIAVLKRERDFLLSARGEFADAGVQTTIPDETAIFVEELRQNLGRKDQEISQLHGIVQKAEEALKTNLATVHRLRLDYERLAAEKKGVTVEFSGRIRDLRREIARLNSLTQRHEATIVAKDTTLRTKEKEMEALLESHADLEQKLEAGERRSERSRPRRISRGSFPPSRTSTRHRQSLFGPSVRDSVILKLGELGDMTDEILREDFQDDEEELLRK